MDFNLRMPGYNVWLKSTVYTTLRLIWTKEIGLIVCTLTDLQIPCTRAKTWNFDNWKQIYSSFWNDFFRNKKMSHTWKLQRKRGIKARWHTVWPTHHACAQLFHPFTGLVGVSVCHLAFIVVNDREVIPQSPRSPSILYLLCVFVCRLKFCKVSWDMITEQSR